MSRRTLAGSLFIIAIVLFLLAALGADVKQVALIPLGLAATAGGLAAWVLLP